MKIVLPNKKEYTASSVNKIYIFEKKSTQLTINITNAILEDVVENIVIPDVTSIKVVRDGQDTVICDNLKIAGVYENITDASASIVTVTFDINSGKK